jgi:hypothetical protein
MCRCKMKPFMRILAIKPTRSFVSCYIGSKDLFAGVLGFPKVCINLQRMIWYIKTNDSNSMYMHNSSRISKYSIKKVLPIFVTPQLYQRSVVDFCPISNTSVLQIVYTGYKGLLPRYACVLCDSFG